MKRIPILPTSSSLLPIIILLGLWLAINVGSTSGFASSVVCRRSVFARSSWVADRRSRPAKLEESLKIPIRLFLEISILEDISSSEPEDNKNEKLPFVEGSVVRVVAKNLRAHQVSLNGYGMFDDNKKFVPAPVGGERKTKSLIMPVGICGVVVKLCDPNISANFPICVKFEPGKHVEEGYDPPVSFLMHFGPDEIELVG